MSKVVVIHLKKDSLEVFAVSGGAKITNAETTWTVENLAEKLRLVVDKFGTQSARVLLVDELVYTKVKQLEEGEKPERLALQHEVESEFPDAVGAMWDYKVEGQEALIFAPVKATMDVLSAAAIAAGLKIEDVEPELFAKRRGDDPVLEIAKKSLKGKDEEVLNLKVEVVEEASKQEAVLSEQSRKEKITISKQTKKLVLILLGAILVGGVVIGGVLRSRSVTKIEPEVVISPQATSTPTPTPTPEPVELDQLSVMIQNGSGVVGEAGAVSEILAAEGFDEEIMEAENADNYDYTKTEVAVRKGLALQVYETIERALNSDYEVVQTDDLTESSDYDVLIIVGSKLIIEEEL